jgi:hypothetical protein
MDVRLLYESGYVTPCGEPYGKKGPSHLGLGRQNGLLPSGLQIKILFALLVSFIRASSTEPSLSPLLGHYSSLLVQIFSSAAGYRTSAI